MGKGKDKKRKKREPDPADGPTMAEKADRYALYQRSVQEPECEVELFEKAYRAFNRKAPRVLREDFCGTFAVCCEWAKKRGRTAVGIDLDPEPIAWGKKHNLAKLTESARKRVTIRRQDVRTVSRVKADVLSAQNFSFWAFHTREELKAYFEIARKNLADGGILVADMMGGSQCIESDRKDVRKYKGYRYVWDQAEFDPISHIGTYRIHFRFKDGSRLKNAFEYNWRFWSIPEVRELLAEAGFSESVVYWEGVDEETGEGDDEWEPVEVATNDPSWIAFIIARR